MSNRPMRGAGWVLLVGESLLSPACSVGDLDLRDKRCPCIDGWVCDDNTNLCVRRRDGSTQTDAGDASSIDTGIERDSGANDDLATETSLVTDAGGFLEASGLADSSAGPEANGAEDASYPADAKGPGVFFVRNDCPDSGTCEVGGDGYLCCGNDPTFAYAQPSLSSKDVNKVTTTRSWFVCWAPGGLHMGGNSTWYFTMGDTTSSWGWVPASAVHTPEGFVTNPSAFQLARCPD